MQNQNSLDAVANQLKDYKEKNPKSKYRATDASGHPQPSLTKSLTVGPNGSILLQDINLLKDLNSFTKERIPERAAYAKGAGGFGYFEVTHDVTKYTKARVFEKIGKQTEVAARFSLTSGETGSSETVRDGRGFAVKFYTEDGNWDVVGSFIPIFFIRDPILFPSLTRVQKRNPVTHLKDPNMFWDFMSLRPETTHNILALFSDRGLPDGFRKMNGYGSHTFKLVNAENKAVYCKFHFRSNQGVVNMTPERANEILMTEADYATRDLYNAIADQNFPSWTLYFQIMTFEEAEKYQWNPFDLTKVWPQADFPLIPVGRMTINRNPMNYFTDVEQAAYSPANLVPGIEASPDKMLAARMFSYYDTQIYRIGSNHAQLAINKPKQKPFGYNRDGSMNSYTFIDGTPDYYPNSFNGPYVDPKAAGSVFRLSGNVERYNTADDDNFSQPNLFYRNVLNEVQRTSLANNIANSLKLAAKNIRERALSNFYKVNEDFGNKVRKALDEALGQKMEEN